jgi:5-methylcytosine-specific restriction endonuclease McrA
MAQTREQKCAYYKAYREANRDRFEAYKPRKAELAKVWRLANAKVHRDNRKKHHTKRRRLKAEGPIDNGITAKAVAERDGMVCAECQGIVKPHPGGYLADGWTIGHIVPLSKGGTHTWDNVQCECHSCNTSKGANQ